MGFYISQERIENLKECRAGCAACCIFISISSPIPGMPDGKSAGERCIQLTTDNRCRLFGKSERPPVCISLKPSKEMCGLNYEYAKEYLSNLEEITKPERVSDTGYQVTSNRIRF